GYAFASVDSNTSRTLPSRLRDPVPALEHRMTGGNLNKTGVIMTRIIGRSLLGLMLIASISGAQQNPREQLLVSPAWLKAHLKDANLVILHVGDPKNFPAGHIPGARFIDMQDVSQADTTGFGEILKRYPDARPPKFVGPANGLSLEMLAPEVLR